MRGSRALALVVIAFVAAACTSSAKRDNLASLQNDVKTLQDRVRRLSYYTASGGGVNLKMMPDPVTGKPTVPLEEQFSFDRNHAICRVNTNRQAFRMTTYKLGTMVIGPNRFYMAMAATSVDQYEVSTGSDGKRRVTMRGGLSCATEVGLTKMTLGSRTVAEHATYLVEATDGGIGGGTAGDTFAFTAFFDPEKAPVNHSIFGPKFTFTGRMVEGEITIVDPRTP